MPSADATWRQGFHFADLSPDVRRKTLELDVLVFPGTAMLEKPVPRPAQLARIRQQQQQQLAQQQLGQLQQGVAQAHSAGAQAGTRGGAHAGGHSAARAGAQPVGKVAAALAAAAAAASAGGIKAGAGAGSPLEITPRPGVAQSKRQKQLQQAQHGKAAAGPSGGEVINKAASVRKVKSPVVGGKRVTAVKAALSRGAARPHVTGGLLHGNTVSPQEGSAKRELLLQSKEGTRKIRLKLTVNPPAGPAFHSASPAAARSRARGPHPVRVCLALASPLAPPIPREAEKRAGSVSPWALVEGPLELVEVMPEEEDVAGREGAEEEDEVGEGEEEGEGEYGLGFMEPSSSRGGIPYSAAATPSSSSWGGGSGSVFTLTPTPASARLASLSPHWEDGSPRQWSPSPRGNRMVHGGRWSTAPVQVVRYKSLKATTPRQRYKQRVLELVGREGGRIVARSGNGVQGANAMVPVGVQYVGLPWRIVDWSEGEGEGEEEEEEAEEGISFGKAEGERGGPILEGSEAAAEPGAVSAVAAAAKTVPGRTADAATTRAVPCSTEGSEARKSRAPLLVFGEHPYVSSPRWCRVASEESRGREAAVVERALAAAAAAAVELLPDEDEGVPSSIFAGEKGDGGRAGGLGREAAGRGVDAAAVDKHVLGSFLAGSGAGEANGSSFGVPRSLAPIRTVSTARDVSYSQPSTPVLCAASTPTVATPRATTPTAGTAAATAASPAANPPVHPAVSFPVSASTPPPAGAAAGAVYPVASVPLPVVGGRGGGATPAASPLLPTLSPPFDKSAAAAAAASAAGFQRPTCLPASNTAIAAAAAAAAAASASAPQEADLGPTALLQLVRTFGLDEMWRPVDVEILREGSGKEGGQEAVDVSVDACLGGQLAAATDPRIVRADGLAHERAAQVAGGDAFDSSAVTVTVQAASGSSAQGEVLNGRGREREREREKDRACAAGNVYLPGSWVPPNVDWRSETEPVPVVRERGGKRVGGVRGRGQQQRGSEGGQ